jgi:hypothetical protein
MKRGEIAHHVLALVLFVSVNSLRVLTKVVETGKLWHSSKKRGVHRYVSYLPRDQKPGGEAARRGYVLDVTGQVLAPGENHATLTVIPALESLCGGWTITLRARLGLLSLENGRDDSDIGHVVLKV